MFYVISVVYFYNTAENSITRKNIKKVLDEAGRFEYDAKSDAGTRKFGAAGRTWSLKTK